MAKRIACPNCGRKTPVGRLIPKRSHDTCLCPPDRSSPSPSEKGSPAPHESDSEGEDYFDRANPIDHKQECQDVHLEVRSRPHISTIDGQTIPVLRYVGVLCCKKHGQSARMALAQINLAAIEFIPDFKAVMDRVFRDFGLEHDRRLELAAGTWLSDKVAADDTVM